MSLFKQYRTDANAEVAGVPVQVSVNEDNTTVEFIVARSGKNNMAYRRAFEKASAPHRKAMQNNTMSNDVAEAMMLDLFVAHLLKGWKNVQADEVSAADFGVKPGENIPFNVGNAKKLMLMLPDLYDELTKASNDISLFIDAQRDVEAKNS